MFVQSFNIVAVFLMYFSKKLCQSDFKPSRFVGVLQYIHYEDTFPNAGIYLQVATKLGQSCLSKNRN